MNNVFVSTCNSIEGASIVAYKGVVSSHIVAGTGIFSEVAAGFKDFFGGRSKTFARHLSRLYDEAIDDLCKKAHALSANGVIGLKIDIDEVSGKNVSMFMITAIGTAVGIEYDAAAPSGSATGVSADTLGREVNKRHALAVLEECNIHSVDEDIWRTIFIAPDNEYIAPLTDILISQPLRQTASGEYKLNDVFVENYTDFAKQADRDRMIMAIYEGLKFHKSAIKDMTAAIISAADLFDAKTVAGLLRSGYLHEAISVLDAGQPSYSQADLLCYEEILAALDGLPNVGRIEETKGGLLSGPTKKFVCRNGHANSTDIEFCLHCGENIKGLLADEVAAIESFRRRTEALSHLLYNATQR